MGVYVPVCARRCMHVCAQWEVDMPDAGIKSGATGLGSLSFFQSRDFSVTGIFGLCSGIFPENSVFVVCSE